MLKNTKNNLEMTSLNFRYFELRLSTLNVKKDTEKATKLTKDIFFHLSNSISLYVVELKALKDYDKHLKMVGSQNESLTDMIAQIEKLGAGYSKIRFVYDFL